MDQLSFLIQTQTAISSTDSGIWYRINDAAHGYCDFTISYPRLLLSLR